MYAVLAGGVGAARFLRGLVEVVDARDLVVVANVGDDIELHGLHVSPDLDTITYTLAGVIHPEQQWGRADEHFTVAAELERYGAQRWFTLGDRDLALHLHRTERLRAGEPLSAVTAGVARAWGLELTLLPATDDPVQTRIHTTDGRDLHFQAYWVGERARPPVARVELAGAAAAKPAPGVLDALRDAEAVLVCPSNPVVSIGTILAVPGIEDALASTTAPVVGVSPIVGGDVVRGMADRLLPAIGVDVSASGVARHYAGWLDGWVVDERDRDAVGEVEALGVACRASDTIMDTPEVAASVASAALALAADLRDATR